MTAARRLLIAAAFCFPSPARAAAALPSALAEMGLILKSTSSYELQADRRWGAWPQENSEWTVTTASGTPKIRLQAYAEVSATSAANKKDRQLQRLLFLYAGDSAYPGMEARPSSAPRALLPELFPSGGSKPEGAFVSATAALTYGNAVEKVSVYRGVLSFLYCPSTRRFFQIELFYPKDGFKKETALLDAARFSCTP